MDTLFEVQHWEVSRKSKNDTVPSYHSLWPKENTLAEAYLCAVEDDSVEVGIECTFKLDVGAVVYVERWLRERATRVSEGHQSATRDNRSITHLNLDICQLRNRHS